MENISSGSCESRANLTPASTVAWGVAAPIRALRKLYCWVLGWADRPRGAIALGAISFVESSFFPIPPDPLMCALCLGKRERSFFFAFITTVTSVLGGVFGWILGMYLFQDVVLWMIDVLGWNDTWFGSPVTCDGAAPALFIEGVSVYPGSYMERADALFRDWGFFAMFAAALTPIPYKVATIASGVFAMPLGTMVAGSVLGRGMRFFAEGALLYYFGARAKAFIEKHFGLLTVLMFILVILGFMALKYVL